MCDSDSKPANILCGSWTDSCAYVKYDPSCILLLVFCGDGCNNMTSIDVGSYRECSVRNDHRVLKCD